MGQRDKFVRRQKHSYTYKCSTRTDIPSLVVSLQLTPEDIFVSSVEQGTRSLCLVRRTLNTRNTIITLIAYQCPR